MTYFHAPDDEQLVYAPPGTVSGSPLSSVAKDAANAISQVARALGEPLRVREVSWRERSDDEIRAAAFEQWRWRDAQGIPGCPEQDWQRARANLIRHQMD